jgi:DNA helicase II / ATP-dependent DNA helicase PcrA
MYGLNDQQYQAVSLTPSPLYVNASAGAGKTRCLVAKVKYLIDNGVDPKSIVSITFTNKAANEMRSRLQSSCDVSKMQISTIHSMCVRIIRSFVRHTRLKLPFTIYDDGDQKSIIKTIIKSNNLPGDLYEYISGISRVKSDMSEPGPELKSVYEKYQEILKQNNAVDFDDLQILAYECLQHEDCRSFYTNLWQHILVDEFQDTSTLQFGIIMSIYNPLITKTLFATGDQNQSIFGWRSARPENIDDFIKTYKANYIALTYNYRSCSEIINHANNFLQLGKPMVPKTPTRGQVSVTEFQSYEDEAEKIALALRQMDNHKGTAIIYRMNSRSLCFEQAFTKYHIAYKVVNDLPFYQRKVTKDLLAVLKAANNQEDRESLSRIINTPKRGFGDSKKELLLLNGRSYVEQVAEEMPLIKSFLNILDNIKGKNPYDAVTYFLNKTGYRAGLTKESDIFMVEALQDLTRQFNSVEDLILASSFIEKDSSEGVNLLTAHASKGLEFDRVFVVGIEDHVWPHQNAEDVDEERRLFYVASTRPRRWLNVSYSKSRRYKNSVLALQPSSLFEDSYKHVHGRDFQR